MIETRWKIPNAYRTGILILVWSVSGMVFSQQNLIDYSLLSHNIELREFRAGNHDPDGSSEYTINVSFYALENSEGERKKDFKDRKKLEFGGDSFPGLTLDNLSFWKPEKEELAGMKVRIEGDKIRELLSQAMLQMEKKENELTIAVKVELIENAKKWFFFGDQVFISDTIYYPIPPTKYDSSLRTNQSLSLSDDVGTAVKFEVVYDNPLSKKSHQENPAAGRDDTSTASATQQ